MADLTLTDDLRRSVALAELRKAMKDADDLASGAKRPPGLTDAARLELALSELTWACVRCLNAFGMSWKPEDRPASWDELRAEIPANPHAATRAGGVPGLRIIEGGKANE